MLNNLEQTISVHILVISVSKIFILTPETYPCGVYVEKDDGSFGVAEEDNVLVSFCLM